MRCWMNQVLDEPGVGWTRCWMDQVLDEPGVGWTRCGYIIVIVIITRLNYFIKNTTDWPFVHCREAVHTSEVTHVLAL